MRATSLRHGAVTALLVAVLWTSPALGLDALWPTDVDAQGHRLKGLALPGAGSDALRLQDMAIGTCLLKATGVNVATFVCGVDGTEFLSPATGLLLGSHAATSVVGRAAGSSGNAADITATADGQFLQRLAGALTWASTLPGSSVTGTPNTVAWFNGSGVLNSLTLAPELTLTVGTLSITSGGIGTTKLADLGVTTAKLADAAVTNAKLAPMPARSFKANATNAPGAPNDLACTGAGQVPQDTGTALVCQQLSYASLSGSPPAITSLTGPVTATGPGAAATTIQANVVANSNLSQAGAVTIKGVPVGSTANVQDVAATGGNQVPLTNGAGTSWSWSSSIPSASLSGIPDTVPFFGSTGALGAATTALGYDPASVRLGSRISSGLPLVQFHLVDEVAASDRGILLGSHQAASSLGQQLQFQRSEGTYASPTAVTASDYLGRFLWQPYTGTQYLPTVAMGVHVSTGGTVTSTNVPTVWWLSQSATGSSGVIDPFPLNASVAMSVANGSQVRVGMPVNTGNTGSSLTIGNAFTQIGANASTTSPGGVEVVIGSRGTIAAPTASTNGDLVATKRWYAYDTTNVPVPFLHEDIFIGANGSGSIPGSWSINPGLAGSLLNKAALHVQTTYDVSVGNLGGQATTDTGGFLWLPQMPGAPTSTPVTPIIQYNSSSLAPLALDTTHDRLYVYPAAAGAWQPWGQFTGGMASGYLRNTTGTGLWSTTATVPWTDVAGAPAFLLDPGSNGIVVRTAIGTTVKRTLTNTDGTVAIANPDGVAGNPIINTVGLQPSGAYITALVGGASASGPGSATVTLNLGNSANLSGALGLGFLAQGGATTNQALTWSGSAWTPSTISTAPSGVAGGALTGTYPNPSIANGVIVPANFSAFSADTVLCNDQSSSSTPRLCTLGTGLSFDPVGHQIFSTVAGGAPASSTYWVSSAASAPSNAVQMQVLGPGLLQQSVSGGVSTPSALNVPPNAIVEGTTSGSSVAADGAFQINSSTHTFTATGNVSFQGSTTRIGSWNGIGSYTGGVVGVAVGGTDYEFPLTFVSPGLSRSGNTVTNTLSTGLSGGQSVIGGAGSGDSLTLRSGTSNNGKINLGLAGSVAVFDEATGKASIGTTSIDAQLHVATSNNTAGSPAGLGTTAWDSKWVALGGSGPNSPSLGVSSSGAGQIYASALAPNVLWQELFVGAHDFQFYSNGSTLGFFQDSSGNIGGGTLSPGGIVTADPGTGRLRAMGAAPAAVALNYTVSYALSGAGTPGGWYAVSSLTPGAGFLAGAFDFEYPLGVSASSATLKVKVLLNGSVSDSTLIQVTRNGSAIGTGVTVDSTTTAGTILSYTTAISGGSASDVYGVKSSGSGSDVTGNIILDATAIIVQ